MSSATCQWRGKIKKQKEQNKMWCYTSGNNKTEEQS